jgi:ABC-type lipoprotein export system ATPase subunit
VTAAGPRLRATALSKSVTDAAGRSLRILDGADLDLRVGEVLAVVGRSGSGKTTLLSAVGLMGSVDSGSIVLDGQEVTRLGDRHRARLRNTKIGFVFQGYSLIPHLTVAENVALPLLHGTRVGRRQVRAKVDDGLESVGLGSRGRSRPHELSGGEQQRVAIARALVRDPALILADEPTGALDVATAESVLDVLFDCVRHRGACLLIVTHDPAVAERADRRVVMDRGRVTPEMATHVGATPVNA